MSSLYGQLGRPTNLVAPMVEQSEYAWRILSMRYGAHLVYTPMYNARHFAASEKYRRQFTTGPLDGPLIVQFCANDPKHLLAAALLVQEQCVAVDLNLGCPQGIARKGHYGAFLMQEWDLIEQLVSTLHSSKDLRVPITCKIRVFPTVEETVAYARMLERAGCAMLTVHGRLREQKAQNTGLADWEKIKAVKQAVSIPVFANGNIMYAEDAADCIRQTGVDGVMIAEGSLHNPALFTGQAIPSYKLAREYLDICRDVQDSATISNIRPHLFRMLHACLPHCIPQRAALSKAKTMQDFYDIVAEIEAKYAPEAAVWSAADGVKTRMSPLGSGLIREYPVWMAQPKIRKLDPETRPNSKLDPETKPSSKLDPETKLSSGLENHESKPNSKLDPETNSSSGLENPEIKPNSKLDPETKHKSDLEFKEGFLVKTASKEVSGTKGCLEARKETISDGERDHGSPAQNSDANVELTSIDALAALNGKRKFSEHESAKTVTENFPPIKRIKSNKGKICQALKCRDNGSPKCQHLLCKNCCRKGKSECAFHRGTVKRQGILKTCCIL
ncbi:MAG: hypothetical protein SGCHY_004576 [Lobulomycetales sp.]